MFVSISTVTASFFSLLFCCWLFFTIAATSDFTLSSCCLFYFVMLRIFRDLWKVPNYFSYDIFSSFFPPCNVVAIGVDIRVFFVWQISSFHTKHDWAIIKIHNSHIFLLLHMQNTTCNSQYPCSISHLENDPRVLWILRACLLTQSSC